MSRDSKFGNVCSAEHKSLPLVLRAALTPFLGSCCVPSASVCEAGGEDLVNKEETDELLPQTFPAYSAPGIAPGLGPQRSSDRPSQTLHPRPGFSSISHPENLLEHRSLGAILPPSTPHPQASDSVALRWGLGICISNSSQALRISRFHAVGFGNQTF